MVVSAATEISGTCSIQNLIHNIFTLVILPPWRLSCFLWRQGDLVLGAFLGEDEVGIRGFFDCEIEGEIFGESPFVFLMVAFHVLLNEEGRFFMYEIIF